MNDQNAGGIDVYVQAHDEAYTAAMRRAAATARQTGTQISQAFQGMGPSIAQFGHRMDVVFTGLGNRMRLLGRDLRALSGTMATVSGFGTYISGRAFIETAGEFEQQMDIIQALSGATERQMQSLEDQTISLGSSTARSANQIAAGALELQKMGRSIDEIQRILPSVTDFSIAADQDVSQSARTAGSVLMQFRMSASETQRVMDTLTRGANQSAADVGDFSIALSYAGQQAYNANVSLERTVALMEAASNAGIPGSRLGTGLQSVLNDIYMPNMRQIQVFRRFGIETRTATGELRDLYDVLQDIFTKMPQNQWARFEVDTQNYLMALRGQGIDSVRERERDLYDNAGGEAARTAAARMQGLKGALDELGGAFDSLMIKAGESGLTRILTKLFRDIGDWVANLSQASTNTIMFGAAITALLLALNPLMFMMGSLLSILTSPEGLIFALASLGVSMAIFSRIEAELKGVGQALDATSAPLQRITSLNQQLATATGDAADAMRRQRQEMTSTLREQARVAELHADMAEAAAEERRNSLGHTLLWGTGVFADAGMAAEGIFGESTQDVAVAARARADTINRIYNDAVQANFDRDGAPQEEDGPPIPPALPNGDLSAMMGMTAAASIERQTRLLEDQARAVGDGVLAWQRYAAIQAIVEQSRDQFGEATMSWEQAGAIHDRQRAAQGAIEHAQAQEAANLAISAQGKALALTRVQIQQSQEEQEQLTQAMLGGERAYERARIALDLLRQNQGMTRDEAERLAAGVEAANDNFARAQERMQRFAGMWRDIGDRIAGAFEEAVVQGESLSDVLKQLAADIIMIAIRAAVIEPLGRQLGNFLSSVLGGASSGDKGGGSSLFSSLIGAVFGGGKAGGGNMWPGAVYEVGEQGRELFVPKVGGTMISNAAMRQGGGGGLGGGIVYAPSYSFTGTAEEIERVKQMVANDRAQFAARFRNELANVNSRGRGWIG